MRFIYWDNKEWVRGGDKFVVLFGVWFVLYVFCLFLLCYFYFWFILLVKLWLCVYWCIVVKWFRDVDFVLREMDGKM